MTTLIVKAYAGTGKTTTIVGGIAPIKGMTPSPEQEAIWKWMKKNLRTATKIAVGAFNKSIEGELTKRLQPQIDRGYCFVKTIHGHGLSLLKQVNSKTRFNENTLRFIMEELLGDDGVRNLWKKSPGVYPAITELVQMVKCNMIDWLDYTALSDLMEYYDIDVKPSEKEQVIELASKAITNSINFFRQKNFIEFVDMVWMPNVLAITPNAKSKYDFCIIDEAQDLNTAQKAIVKRLAPNHIYVGDPNQAIYGFAGAESDSMDSLQNSDDDITNLSLTYTRRCGKRIVEKAQSIVPDFNYYETNPDGALSYTKDTFFNDNLLHEQTLGKTDMILCRTNAPLIGTFFRLLKVGRPATIIGRNIGKNLIRFIKKFECDKTSDLLGKLDDWYSEEMNRMSKKKYVSESKKMNIEDKYTCCQVLAGQHTEVPSLIGQLEEIFKDNAGETIRLSSVHRAKGLEAHKVHILTPEKMPHPMAKTKMAQEQEKNLMYVAWTRAIKELNFINTSKKEDNDE